MKRFHSRVINIALLGCVGVLPTPSCKRQPTHSRAYSEDVASSVYLKIVSTEAAGLRLVASAPQGTEQLWFCLTGDSCPSGSGTAAARLGDQGDRVFFSLNEAIAINPSGQSFSVGRKTSVNGAPTEALSVFKLGPVATQNGADYDWKANIILRDVNAVSRRCAINRYKARYCDVMTHSRNVHLESPTTNTDLHETQHLLAAEHYKSGYLFIYWRDGKGADFPEPKSRTGDITDEISMRDVGRYYNYITRRSTQPIGENLFDDWRAYATEEISGIERHDNADQYESGSVQFLYFASAAMHGVAKREPAFITQKDQQPYKQAWAVFAMMAEETKFVIEEGAKKGHFQGAHNAEALALANAIATDPRNAAIRATLVTVFGPTWTQRVLGFSN